MLLLPTAVLFSATCTRSSRLLLPFWKRFQCQAPITGRSPRWVRTADMSMKGNVEYAKSARSTCKGCSKSIEKGVLRIGLTTRDPRGFDATKWYHSDCYFSPRGPPRQPLENLLGLSLLKAGDRARMEALAAATVAGASAKRAREGPDDDGDALRDSEVRGGEGEREGAGSSPKRKAVTAETDADGNRQGTLTTTVPAAEVSGEWRKILLSFSPKRLAKIYKGATLPNGWSSFHTVIIGEPTPVHPSHKIAAFDFDGCLAKTDIRRHGATAWSLQFPTVPARLHEYHKQGYKLVVVSNESNIDAWVNSRQKAVDSKIGRMTAFMAGVEAPMQVFIACGKSSNPSDFCRKPLTGIWDILTEHMNGDVAVKKEECFFVGDAAGRPNDHSRADIDFAKNVGIKFMTPEEVFL